MDASLQEIIDNPTEGEKALLTVSFEQDVDPQEVIPESAEAKEAGDFNICTVSIEETRVEALLDDERVQAANSEGEIRFGDK